MNKKAFYGFLTLIIVVAIVIACAVGSSWFTNGNIKTWFNGWGQGVETENNSDGFDPVLPDDDDPANKPDELNVDMG